MSLYKRGETWWIYITHNGQRIRRSTGTADKARAEAIHDQLKVDLRKRKESGKTLSDALKLWLTAQERSKREISAVRIFRAAYPSRPLSEVDGHAILDALQDKSPGNYNRIANNVRAAINMAVERGWCDPITIPRRKSANKRLRFLRQDEWARLEKELPEHVRLMAQFAISTGLRQANVFGLQWRDVDLKRAVAWVDSTDAKSKKPIPIPLSPYAVRLLESRQDKHATHVFTWNDKPVGSVKTAWNKALIRAKIDVIDTGEVDKLGRKILKSTFRWHDLRHTWASWHVMNGTPLAVLKELGGWHDMSMVMRYAHLAPDHLTQYAGNAIESVA